MRMRMAARLRMRMAEGTSAFTGEFGGWREGGGGAVLAAALRGTQQ